MRRIFFAVALACAATRTTALAQSSGMYPNAGALKWGPPPPVFAAGAKFTVLSGDPTKSGPYTIRLSMPSGYRILPHYHPTDEYVTVISGTFHVGMGDKFDRSKTTAFTGGGFGTVPANMRHYAWASGRTVVQVSGNGPFQLIYVNPADMPKTH
jgi:Cupin domain.